MSLEPLRQAFLEQAQTDSERIRAEASARAAEQVERVEREGAASVERARAQGGLAGGLQVARAVAVARRSARGVILRAKLDLYDELHVRAHEAVFVLRADPSYRALLESLAATARRQLGDDAVLEIDPADAGGVRAAVGGRSVDYTLVALTERCLRRLAGRLEELWT
jgi:vacuolar-type H+-ATPase subunit E/Vma4